MRTFVKALALIILGLYHFGIAITFLSSKLSKKPLPNPFTLIVGQLGALGEYFMEIGFKIHMMKIKRKGSLDKALFLEFQEFMKTQEGILGAKDASLSMQKHYPHNPNAFINYLQNIDHFDFQCTFTYSHFLPTGRLHPYIAHLRRQYFSGESFVRLPFSPLHKYFFEGMTTSTMRHRFETYQWNKFLERADVPMA